MNIAIIGASGAVGSAFISIILKKYDVSNLYAFSRTGQSFDHSRVVSNIINLEDENSIAHAASYIQEKLDLIIVATGILHDNDTLPEKSLKELSSSNFQKLFSINTIGPALVAKHFLPLLAKDKTPIMAFLSARVGSISDNNLGGWYSYRASKAALNMIIKNLSIEVARKNKNAVIVGIHPGTVDSKLSKPFQSNIQKEKLFTPEHSAKQMLNVIDKLQPENSGSIFAYDGQKIEY
jgi:NAD(P)-dependent dehydrogenase (short-subunit alcohol dehydrogenase family)